MHKADPLGRTGSGDGGGGLLLSRRRTGLGRCLRSTPTDWRVSWGKIEMSNFNG